MNDKKKRVFITGATGFIGSHLALNLLKKGHKVTCLVRDRRRAEFLRRAGASFIVGNINDLSSLKRKEPNRVDIFFHCAALVGSFPIGLLRKINVDGTINMCLWAKKLKAERFIYTSSVAVVSGNSQAPLREDLPFKASNPYGQSKAEAEEAALEFRNKGLPLVIIRPPMVYGEDEPHLMRKLIFLLKLRAIPLIDSVAGVRLHLGYIENVVDAMVYSMNSDKMLEGAFFAADDEALTIRQILEAMRKGLGIAGPIWNLSIFQEKILSLLPYFKKRISFLKKERIYSTERIRSAGFRARFKAIPSLERSVRSMIIKKSVRLSIEKK